MSTPFVGQIDTVGFPFAPVNWAKCNGQVIAITQNETLFQLIGTTYGGDGITTFGYPNMQSRMPIHQGTGLGLSTYVLGQAAGAETVTLNSNTMGQHTHALMASTTAATTQGATANTSVLATGVDGNTNDNPLQTPKIYIPASASTGQVNLAAQSIGSAGGSQAFSTIQPCLTINFVIALFGVFPTQN